MKGSWKKPHERLVPGSARRPVSPPLHLPPPPRRQKSVIFRSRLHQFSGQTALVHRTVDIGLSEVLWTVVHFSTAPATLAKCSESPAPPSTGSLFRQRGEKQTPRTTPDGWSGGRHRPRIGQLTKSEATCGEFPMPPYSLSALQPESSASLRPCFVGSALVASVKPTRTFLLLRSGWAWSSRFLAWALWASSRHMPQHSVLIGRCGQAAVVPDRSPRATRRTGLPGASRFWPPSFPRLLDTSVLCG